MAHAFAGSAKSMSAIAPSIGTIGTMTAIEVNCTGYDRVLYTLNLGVAAGGGLIDMKIQDSILTSGALADVPGAVLTQVTKALGDSTVQTIDLRVNGSRPFQKALVVTTTGAFPNSVTATLYSTTPAPPTPAVGTQVVIA